MRLCAAQPLREQYLASDFGMRDHCAAVGPQQRPDDEPEPRFAGRVEAGIIQGELRRRAAQHGLDPHGCLPSAFRERSRGGSADSQVVDAWPALAEAGAVFAGGLVPGVVGQYNPAVTIQRAGALRQGVERHLSEFVGLDGLP